MSEKILYILLNKWDGTEVIIRLKVTRSHMQPLVGLNNVMAFYGELTGFGENEMIQPKVYSIVWTF